MTNRLYDRLGVIDVHDKPGSSIGEQTEIRTRFLPDIFIPVSVLYSLIFDKLVRRWLRHEARYEIFTPFSVPQPEVDRLLVHTMNFL